MQTHQLLTIAALALLVVACKPGAHDAGAAESATPGADAIRGQANDSVPGREDGSARGASSATPPGGAFARAPDFRLPVPISSAPVVSGSVPQSRAVDPAGIRTALIEGMETAGANIRVGVEPGGIVSLSGEVASVAELQRAHYLARAQPGVVEVDYRQLLVRQR